MTKDLTYVENVVSNKTESLFVGLALLFFALFTWRVRASRPDPLAAALFFLGGVFSFYALNYRTLQIRATAGALKLKFGIFSWTVPLDNIEAYGLDDVPYLLRFGGAGIHFMSVRQRYRASFNFLEYSRVVIAFKRKVGPVVDLSFSTRRPEEVLRFLQQATAAGRANG